MWELMWSFSRAGFQDEFASLSLFAGKWQGMVEPQEMTEPQDQRKLGAWISAFRGDLDDQ